ncbi:MAG TPA: YbaL family putative K(+) efflux transporter [Rhodopila sp.]|uniref:YbaL family putative K(+) efflux transporter n=1 Tax=Rhodopila sp. TaxID=2480087 RepID=UPI002C25360D|nr:YbaL family putative K(+) efflux transporter [Rhodopila sp.]HVY18375.1 YbaL family putative K(+) efflux transporter [Rhodopila sp.]
MPHETPLIGILVIGLGLAFLLGTLANRLKISLLVGYLLAGVAVGPFTPGFVADQDLTLQLAEVGVVLLMFGVGLHFSLKDLAAVRAVAIPGALIQMVLTSCLGVGLAGVLGLPWGAGVVFALALSIASTVVLLRALQDRRLMDTERGHLAVGWLVVQDLMTVLALVLLPALAPLLRHDASGSPTVAALALTFAITLGKVAAFIALMLLIGRRVIPAMMHYVAHTGSRELFRLSVLAVALGVAFAAAELFGVSFALGAFVAGMVLSESQLSQRAAEETLPLRDAFAVLFFISVGMLFDPTILVRSPLPLLGTLAVVLVGTPAIAVVILRAMRQTWSASLTIAAGLAQIGEFSFILAALGIGLGLLSQQARDLILGTSILSILMNPLLFLAVDRLRPWADRRDGILPAVQGPAAVTKPIEYPVTSLRGHAVLVGYGRVGKMVAHGLLERGWKLLVMEAGDAAVQPLREVEAEVLVGNAADPDILKAANLASARLLLVAIPDAFEAGQIVEQARAANPDLEIIARAHLEAAVTHLQEHGANAVVMGEHEIARAILDLARGWEERRSNSAA